MKCPSSSYTREFLCCTSNQIKKLYSADLCPIYLSVNASAAEGTHHHCRGEYREECLWSVMKMNLLQMAEDCGEVDVFQTVYHVYNSILFQSSPYSNYYNAPSPSSPSSPQPLKLDTDTYRNMHDFALKVCNASHLYERLATNIEDKHVYAKAENKKNVYYNEA